MKTEKSSQSEVVWIKQDFKDIQAQQAAQEYELNQILYLQTGLVFVLAVVYFIIRYFTLPIEAGIFNLFVASLIFLVIRFIMPNISLIWVVLLVLCSVLCLDFIGPLLLGLIASYNFMSFIWFLPGFSILSLVEIIFK